MARSLFIVITALMTLAGLIRDILDSGTFSRPAVSILFWEPCPEVVSVIVAHFAFALCRSRHSRAQLLFGVQRSRRGHGLDTQFFRSSYRSYTRSFNGLAWFCSVTGAGFHVFHVFALNSEADFRRRRVVEPVDAAVGVGV